MNTILVIFAMLVAWSIACWIIETLPLPAVGGGAQVPKRLAQAALGVAVLVWLAQHFHWANL